MGWKFGLTATTSFMTLVAFAGCARWSEDSVARDVRFNVDDPSLNEPFCDAVWETCDTSSVALLNAPNNVVYTTRAGLTPDVSSEDLETDAQNSTPEDTGTVSESVDNKD